MQQRINELSSEVADIDEEESQEDGACAAVEWGKGRGWMGGGGVVGWAGAHRQASKQANKQTDTNRHKQTQTDPDRPRQMQTDTDTRFLSLPPLLTLPPFR